MIGTAATEKQLTAIDGATALGQLADDALLAVLRWSSGRELSPVDGRSLAMFASLLEQISASVEDPIRLRNSVASPNPASRLDSFAPNLAGAALGLAGTGSDASSEVAALQDLRKLVVRLINGDADDEAVERLRAALEAIARSMLSAADALLAPASRTSWNSTSDF